MRKEKTEKAGVALSGMRIMIYERFGMGIPIDVIGMLHWFIRGGNERDILDV